MAKKNSIESAAISFTPGDDGSFSCELRSNLGSAGVQCGGGVNRAVLTKSGSVSRSLSVGSPCSDVQR